MHGWVGLMCVFDMHNDLKNHHYCRHFSGDVGINVTINLVLCDSHTLLKITYPSWIRINTTELLFLEDDVLIVHIIINYMFYI